MNFAVDIRINTSSHGQAQRLAVALDVEPEICPEVVQRRVSVDDCTLCLSFRAVDPAWLRVSVGSFLEYTVLALQVEESLSPQALQLMLAA